MKEGACGFDTPAKATLLWGLVFYVHVNRKPLKSSKCWWSLVAVGLPFSAFEAFARVALQFELKAKMVSILG